MATMVFALTLLLVCAHTAHSTTTTEAVTFDVTKPYDSFFQKMHDALVAGDTKKAYGHEVLPEATRNSPPRRWLKVELLGLEGDKASLFFRDDTIYLLAFANKTGSIFSMEGAGKLFPGSHALSFSETYGSLTGKGKSESVSDKLQQVPIGKAESLAATKILSSYAIGTPEETAKNAILNFCLTIAEALRFKPIKAEHAKTWLGGTAIHLTEVQAQYLGNWRNLSLLFCRRDTAPWQKYKAAMDRMAIKDAKQLEETLDLVLATDKNDCARK